MPTAEAHVRTPRADRYLTQLCDHLGHLPHEPRAHGHGLSPVAGHSDRDGHGSPPAVRGIDRGDNDARVEFDWGSCLLTASRDALTVRVQADDAAALASGQELMARRIETIGRREGLTVTWQALEPG